MKLKFKLPGLATQIFLGLVLGILVGAAFPDLGKQLKPLGDIFIRMIKMIVVPLIFSSLVMGIAGTGDFKKLGRLGGKSIFWFEFATTIALIVGLIVVNVLQPGVGVAIQAGDSTAIADAAKKGIDHVAMLVNIIPTNIVDAMARQDMLQIIFFSCFFAVAAAGCGKEGQSIINLSKSIAHIMFKFTHYVMCVAPIGIFGSIAYTVGTYGLGMLLPLGKLILSLYAALIIFLIIMMAIASAFTKINMFHFIAALKEPLLLAFSTAASEAALPIAMEKLEKLGVPKHIVSFVLPLGYTFNLDGSTLYSALATVFIAQVYGIPFPIETQLLMLITLMLSTKGIAAVPGASLIVIAGTATAFGLPVEGIAIILGVDRVLDMARTVCNVTGNCIASVIVARWENEMSPEAPSIAYRESLANEDN
ncbi:MAG: cation:dicarboxylase symporter family transporter [Selenomonas sp.]|nr:cation:dicarboxylase symporter family transporter [Selenomonas sp.]